MKTAFILRVDDVGLTDHRGDDVTKGQRLLSSYRKEVIGGPDIGPVIGRRAGGGEKEKQGEEGRRNGERR